VRLFAQYPYRLTRADTTGSLFERVRRTLEGSPTVQFLLEDSPEGTGMARVLKRFPELAPFRRTAQDITGRTLVHVVHLDARFRDHAPEGPVAGVDAAMLANLANGIPRSFPVHNAVFYFPEVSWAGVTAREPVDATGGWYAIRPANTGASPVPGIILTSHWRSTRRQIELHATVPLATPASDARDLPEVSEPVRRKLGTLGTFRPPRLRLVLDASEALSPADSNRLREIEQSWDRAVPALLDDLPLPHALPLSPDILSPGPGLIAGPRIDVASQGRARIHVRPARLEVHLCGKRPRRAHAQEAERTRQQTRRVPRPRFGL
jgi:hypothetical protein